MVLLLPLFIDSNCLIRSCSVVEGAIGKKVRSVRGDEKEKMRDFEGLVVDEGRTLREAEQHSILHRPGQLLPLSHSVSLCLSSFYPINTLYFPTLVMPGV